MDDSSLPGLIEPDDVLPDQIPVERQPKPDPPRIVSTEPAGSVSSPRLPNPPLAAQPSSVPSSAGSPPAEPPPEDTSGLGFSSIEKAISPVVAAHESPPVYTRPTTALRSQLVEMAGEHLSSGAKPFGDFGPLRFRATERERAGFIENTFDQFMQQLTSGNQSMMGSALMAVGSALNDEGIYNFGQGQYNAAKSYSWLTDEQEARGVWSDFVGALGTSAPSLVAILGGALLGPVGVTAGIGSALLFSYLQNTGEHYEEYRNQGIDQKKAANIAVTSGLFAGLLDAYGAQKVVSSVLPWTKELKGSLAERIGKSVVEGATAEGLTEAAQGTIRETSAYLFGGEKAFNERALGIGYEGFIGSLVGGSVSLGVSGVKETGRAINDGEFNNLRLPEQLRRSPQTDLPDPPPAGTDDGAPRARRTEDPPDTPGGIPESQNAGDRWDPRTQETQGDRAEREEAYRRQQAEQEAGPLPDPPPAGQQADPVDAQADLPDPPPADQDEAQPRYRPLEARSLPPFLDQLKKFATAAAAIGGAPFLAINGLSSAAGRVAEIAKRLTSGEQLESEEIQSLRDEADSLRASLEETRVELDLGQNSDTSDVQLREELLELDLPEGITIDQVNDVLADVHDENLLQHPNYVLSFRRRKAEEADGTLEPLADKLEWSARLDLAEKLWRARLYAPNTEDIVADRQRKKEAGAALRVINALLDSMGIDLRKERGAISGANNAFSIGRTTLRRTLDTIHRIQLLLAKLAGDPVVGAQAPPPPDDVGTEADEAAQEAEEAERAGRLDDEVGPEQAPIDEALKSPEAVVAYSPSSEYPDTPVRYAVVPVEDLLASHDFDGNEVDGYPQRYQNRDRGRGSYIETILQMVADLSPIRLSDGSNSPSTGSPIIRELDRMVISGNGRSIALQRLYRLNNEKAQAYRDEVRAAAARQGIDPDAVDAIKNPVLVRLYEGQSADLDAFVRVANEAETTQHTSEEQAESDASRITDDMIRLFEPDEQGNLSAASNRKFVSAFIEALPPTEQTIFFTQEGNLTEDGRVRIMRAVFFYTYHRQAQSQRTAQEEITEDRQKGIIAELYATKETTGVGNILRIMERVLKYMAPLRAYSEAQPELDLPGFVALAVNEIRQEIQRQGNIESAAETLKSQQSLEIFDQLPTVLRRLAVYLAENHQKITQSSDMLERLAKLTLMEAKRNEEGTLIDSAPLTFDQILEAVMDRGWGTAQADLNLDEQRQPEETEKPVQRRQTAAEAARETPEQPASEAEKPDPPLADQQEAAQSQDEEPPSDEAGAQPETDLPDAPRNDETTENEENREPTRRGDSATARPSVLYHTTSPKAAVEIIKSGVIRGSYDNAGRVSMSRSSYYAHNKNATGRNKFGSIVFHIDEERLKFNHRVRAGNPITFAHDNKGFSQSWTTQVPLKYVTHISLEMKHVDTDIEKQIQDALKQSGHAHIQITYHGDFNYLVYINILREEVESYKRRFKEFGEYKKERPDKWKESDEELLKQIGRYYKRLKAKYDRIISLKENDAGYAYNRSPPNTDAEGTQQQADLPDPPRNEDAETTPQAEPPPADTENEKKQETERLLNIDLRSLFAMLKSRAEEYLKKGKDEVYYSDVKSTLKTLNANMKALEEGRPEDVVSDDITSLYFLSAVIENSDAFNYSDMKHILSMRLDEKYYRDNFYWPEGFKTPTREGMIFDADEAPSRITEAWEGQPDAIFIQKDKDLLMSPAGMKRFFNHPTGDANDLISGNRWPYDPADIEGFGDWTVRIRDNNWFSMSLAPNHQRTEETLQKMQAEHDNAVRSAQQIRERGKGGGPGPASGGPQGDLLDGGGAAAATEKPDPPPAEPEAEKPDAPRNDETPAAEAIDTPAGIGKEIDRILNLDFMSVLQDMFEKMKYQKGTQKRVELAIDQLKSGRLKVSSLKDIPSTAITSPAKRTPFTMMLRKKFPEIESWSGSAYYSKFIEEVVRRLLVVPPNFRLPTHGLFGNYPWLVSEEDGDFLPPSATEAWEGQPDAIEINYPDMGKHTNNRPSKSIYFSPAGMVKYFGHPTGEMRHGEKFTLQKDGAKKMKFVVIAQGRNWWQAVPKKVSPAFKKIIEESEKQAFVIHRRSGHDPHETGPEVGSQRSNSAGRPVSGVQGDILKPELPDAPRAAETRSERAGRPVRGVQDDILDDAGQGETGDRKIDLKRKIERAKKEIEKLRQHPQYDAWGAGLFVKVLESHDIPNATKKIKAGDYETAQKIIDIDIRNGIEKVKQEIKKKEELAARAYDDIERQPKKQWNERHIKIPLAEQGISPWEGQPLTIETNIKHEQSDEGAPDIYYSSEALDQIWQLPDTDTVKTFTQAWHAIFDIYEEKFGAHVKNTPLGNNWYHITFKVTDIDGDSNVSDSNRESAAYKIWQHIDTLLPPINGSAAEPEATGRPEPEPQGPGSLRINGVPKSSAQGGNRFGSMRPPRTTGIPYKKVTGKYPVELVKKLTEMYGEPDSVGGVYQWTLGIKKDTNRTQLYGYISIGRADEGFTIGFTTKKRNPDLERDVVQKILDDLDIPFTVRRGLNDTGNAEEKRDPPRNASGEQDKPDPPPADELAAIEREIDEIIKNGLVNPDVMGLIEVIQALLLNLRYETEHGQTESAQTRLRAIRLNMPKLRDILPEEPTKPVRLSQFEVDDGKKVDAIESEVLDIEANKKLLEASWKIGAGIHSLKHLFISYRANIGAGQFNPAAKYLQSILTQMDMLRKEVEEAGAQSRADKPDPPPAQQAEQPAPPLSDELKGFINGHRDTIQYARDRLARMERDKEFMAQKATAKSVSDTRDVIAQLQELLKAFGEQPQSADRGRIESVADELGDLIYDLNIKHGKHQEKVKKQRKARPEEDEDADEQADEAADEAAANEAAAQAEAAAAAAEKPKDDTGLRKKFSRHINLLERMASDRHFVNLRGVKGLPKIQEKIQTIYRQIELAEEYLRESDKKRADRSIKYFTKMILHMKRFHAEYGSSSITKLSHSVLDKKPEGVSFLLGKWSGDFPGIPADVVEGVYGKPTETSTDGSYWYIRFSINDTESIDAQMRHQNPESGRNKMTITFAEGLTRAEYEIIFHDIIENLGLTRDDVLDARQEEKNYEATKTEFHEKIAPKLAREADEAFEKERTRILGGKEGNKKVSSEALDVILDELLNAVNASKRIPKDEKARFAGTVDGLKDRGIARIPKSFIGRIERMIAMLDAYTPYDGLPVSKEHPLTPFDADGDHFHYTKQTLVEFYIRRLDRIRWNLEKKFNKSKFSGNSHLANAEYLWKIMTRWDQNKALYRDGAQSELEATLENYRLHAGPDAVHKARAELVSRMYDSEKQVWHGRATDGEKRTGGDDPITLMLDNVRLWPEMAVISVSHDHPGNGGLFLPAVELSDFVDDAWTLWERWRHIREQPAAEMTQHDMEDVFHFMPMLDVLQKHLPLSKDVRKAMLQEIVKAAKHMQKRGVDVPQPYLEAVKNGGLKNSVGSKDHWDVYIRSLLPMWSAELADASTPKTYPGEALLKIMLEGDRTGKVSAASVKNLAEKLKPLYQHPKDETKDWERILAIVEKMAEHGVGYSSELAEKFRETRKSPVREKARQATAALRQAERIARGAVIGMNAEAVRREVRTMALNNGWRAENLPEIFVAENAQDASAQLSTDGNIDFGDVEAATFRNSSGHAFVVINAANIASPGRLREVIAHELITHVSMYQMLGREEFNRLMSHFYRQRNDPLVKWFARRHGDTYDLNGRRPRSEQERQEFAEEVIARAVEYRQKHPLITRIINAVARFLERIGLKGVATYNRMQELISAAARRLAQDAELRANRKDSGKPEPPRAGEPTVEARFSYGRWTKPLSREHRAALNRSAKSGETVNIRRELGGKKDPDGHKRWTVRRGKGPKGAHIAEGVTSVVMMYGGEKVSQGGQREAIEKGQRNVHAVLHGSLLPYDEAEVQAVSRGRGYEEVSYYPFGAADGRSLGFFLMGDLSAAQREKLKTAGTSPLPNDVADAIDRSNERLANNFHGRKMIAHAGGIFLQTHYERGMNDFDARYSRKPAQTTNWRTGSTPIETLFRAPFAAIGGIQHGTKGTEWAFGAKMAERTKELMWRTDVQENTPAGRVANVTLNRLRRTWALGGKTPEALGSAQKKAISSMQKMQEEADALFAKLQNLSPMQRYLGHEMIVYGKEMNDAELQALEGPVRNFLAKWGRRLADLGLLDERSYERSIGRYLHRTFIKEVLQRRRGPLTEGATRAVHGADFDAQKLRGPQPIKLRDAQVKRILGLQDIKELWEGGEYEVVTTVRQKGDKTEYDHYLILPGGRLPEVDVRRIRKREKEFEKKGWTVFTVKPKRTFEIRIYQREGRWTYRLQRDWDRDELEKFGELTDLFYNFYQTAGVFKEMLSKGELFLAIARDRELSRPNNPDSSLYPEGENIYEGADIYNDPAVETAIDYDWVVVPKSRVRDGTPLGGPLVWGELAGRLVREDVWHDIHQGDKMNRVSERLWLQYFDKAQSIFRQFNTVWSPKTHVLNFVSNSILAHLHLVRGRHLVEAAHHMWNQTELFRRAQRMGVFSSGSVMLELGAGMGSEKTKRLIRQFERDQASGDFLQGPRNFFLGIYDHYKFVQHFAAKSYAWEDEIYRMGAFIRDVEMGLDDETAATNAIKQFVDYGSSSMFVRNARRWTHPFIKWIYGVIPSLGEAMVRRPWQYASLFAMFSVAIPALVNWLNDKEQEEVDADIRSMHKSVQGKILPFGTPQVLQLPLTDSEGRPMYMNIDRFFPGYNLDSDFNALGYPDILMPTGIMVHLIEQVMNINIFDMENIAESDDTPLEAAQRRLGHTYRTMTPNALFVPGSWDWRRMEAAIGGRNDWRGDPVTVPSALLYSLGLKVFSHDAQLRRTWQLKEYSVDMDRLTRSLRALNRKRTRNQIGESAYNRQRRSIENKMRRRTEEFRELRAATQ